MSESVVTTVAKEKMVKARAGVLPLSPIRGMAFGDGAINNAGDVMVPTPDQTALNNELLRKDIDGFKEMSNICYRYTCTLAEKELGGKNISEIGLIDADGDLIAVKNFLQKGKDDDMEMIFEIDDQF